MADKKQTQILLINYRVEEPYFSAIDRKKLPPRIRPEDCTGKAKILSEIRKYQGMEAYTEADWDELRAVYLGMCMKIDHQFGRLLSALKELGLYDDCAIFFLSDHGDFTGDYALAEKAQNTFEDCLTRVPLLIMLVQPGIEADGGIKVVDKGVGFLLKPSGPEFHSNRSLLKFPRPIQNSA